MKLNTEVAKAQRKLVTALNNALKEAKRARLAVNETGGKPEHQLAPFTSAVTAINDFLAVNAKANSKN